MASDAGVIATEAQPPSSNEASAATTTTTTTSLPAEEAVRLLKRQREPSPSSPRSLASSPVESAAKSARLALATPLTGAAALEDELRRREAEAAANPPETSENPSHKVLTSLMSDESQAISRPADAPVAAPTATMEAVSKPVNTISTPSNHGTLTDEREDASSHSATSVPGVSVTASPGPMDVDNRGEQNLAQQVAGQEERLQPGSLSYPGSLQSSAPLGENASRGMSYPVPTAGQTSPTSNGKKHKCPYCNTEFTRHHNLKSHLLTHSQEKPYVCTDCQMRFRRLHDLKRHGKLHTGEKPHICPKCDRKFARGDALARHSKGAGGCAGRRSSMGSFADGDELDGGGTGEGDESAMSGVSYDQADDDDLRRQSLPSINAQHVSTGGENYNAHARTYPPAGTRPSGGGLHPPGPNSAVAAATNASNSMASNHTPSTSISSGAVSGGSGGMYSQAGMTESPKPLSPAVTGHDARQRSPSLTQQFQQQQIGRRQSELPLPHNGLPMPKLPGLPAAAGFSGPSSGGFSHARTGSGTQGSGDSGNNMFAQADPSVWTYIQTLEEKVKSLTDKVTSLDHEMASLRSQVGSRDNVAPVPGPAPAP